MNPVVLEGCLEDRVEHVEAALVGGEDSSVDAHAAEGADSDPTVWISAPGAAPVFELNELVRGLIDEVLNHVLVGDEIAALDRVLEMKVKAIGGGLTGQAIEGVGANDRGGTTLRSDRVAAHGVDLGHEADTGAFFCSRDRRPES